ncbi:hypothetical protein C8R43DRAFT_17720 [Mycena crocata]|nr:hypothetical protein C8R43DRAFT_17720 [Mycena crocata]
MSFLASASLLSVEPALDNAIFSHYTPRGFGMADTSRKFEDTVSSLDELTSSAAFLDVNSLFSVRNNFSVSLSPSSLPPASFAPDGMYKLHRDELMHAGPPIVFGGREVRQWAFRPMPTAQYDMGLSFDTPGWHAPAYRSPECAAIETGCINPALLMCDEGCHTIEPTHDFQLESAAATFQALEIATAAREDEGSDDEPESESEEQNESEGGSDNDNAMDSDFEEPPKASVRPRVVRQLPRCAAHQPSQPRMSRWERRSARVAFTPTPSPSPPPSKKRVAARQAAPRSAKKAAVSARLFAPTATKAPRRTHPRSATKATATSTAPVALPVLPARGRGRARPADSDGIPEQYLYLRDMGCTLVSGGILCNIGGCTRRMARIQDMDRHVLTHFPAPWTCTGCPCTFARKDSWRRHHQREEKNGDHFTAAREVMVGPFNALPTVIQMRGECPPDDKDAKEALNRALKKMFNTLVAA